MLYLRLILFVAGQTSRTERAIDNVRRICDHVLPEQYDLEIVDVLDQPQRAEIEKILATPTLIREQPLPQRRIVGDLSDTDKVVLALNLQTYGHPGGIV